MSFKITNVDKKDVCEQCVWEKVLGNGKRIYFEENTWYRWGEVWVEEDPRENGWTEGEALVTDTYGRMDHSLNDGCWTDRVGVENLSKKEQKLLEATTFYPEEAGWECSDCEIVFYGPVEIEEVAD